MRIPEAVVQTILSRTRIEDLVSEYTSLQLRGDRYWGLSPFKAEKTPSFTVSPDKGLYYCFSTKKGGTAIQFLMEIEGIGFVEAIERLAAKAGVELKSSESLSPGELEDFKIRKALDELYTRVAGSFHWLLQSHPEGQFAREYLQKRGVTPAAIETYNLGYAPEDPFWLHSFLTKKGYTKDFLAECGLFSKKNPRWCIFSGRIMFPIKDSRGQVVAFGARILKGEGPKYLNSPETRNYKKRTVLYGYWEAREAIRSGKLAVICEGYMDVISFHLAGINCAVAPLGTAFTQDQAKLLKRHNAQALLFFDTDDAGLAATDSAISVLEQSGIDTKIVDLDGISGKDPGEILAESGSQALSNTLYSTSNVLDYLLKRAVAMHDVSTPDGKVRVAEQLFPYIAAMTSDLKKEAALEALSDRLASDLKTVQREFRAFLGRASRGVSRNQPAQPETRQEAAPIVFTSDLLLMLIVTVNFEKYAEIRKQLETADLVNPAAKELYVVLEELYRGGESSLDLLLTKIENEELRSLVLEKARSDEYKNDTDRILRDAVRRVLVDKFTRKRNEVEAKIRVLSSQKNAEANHSIEDLIREKMFLDQELIELR